MKLDGLLRNVGQLLGEKDASSTVQRIRDVMDGFAAMLNEGLPEVGAFHPDIAYRNVDGRTMTLDVIVPKGAGPFPVLVYIHGGAWVWGSPATHRKLTFRLAQQGFLTLSVDYRLAPEHPFPAGFNDCVHAVHFAANNAHQWGGDTRRLVVAGDSAGANLAAATAIDLARTAGAPTIRAVGLAYGVFDFSFGSEEPDGFTQLLIDAYLGGEAHLVKDPRVSPLLKGSQLPPAHIAIGTDDGLIEDSEALRAVLARAGKVHDYHVYEDMPHAFMQMEFLPAARTSLKRMTNFLHESVSAQPGQRP